MPKQSADGYETFRFYNPNVEELPTFADQSVEAMAIIQKRLKKDLEDAGLKEAGADADLVITYLVVVQNNTVTTAISDYYQNSGIEIIEAAHEYVQDHKPNRRFEAGTVIVDVIDASTQRLIYRDFATREVIKGSTGEERKQAIESATDEAIQAFTN
ncbi:MAG: DUF4136 domain-containing protein [Verrucomicrobiota bacterium]